MVAISRQLVAINRHKGLFGAIPHDFWCGCLPNPDLPFLAFSVKCTENDGKKTRIFLPRRTPKILGKEKHSKKQGIPCQRKKKGIPKKQGKDFQGMPWSRHGKTQESLDKFSRLGLAHAHTHTQPMAPYPQYGWDFRKKNRKNSGKTPETLSECFLEFLSRVRLGCPKPYNSRHLRLRERFQNSLPPPIRLGTPLFSELVPERALEAQQRYFSHRAILLATVSQNSFVLVFMGYRTIIARYVAKWGIAEMRLYETSYQGGVSHHFGGVLTSLKKYRAIWGIAAIVSQYRAIWGH